MFRFTKILASRARFVNNNDARFLSLFENHLELSGTSADGNRTKFHYFWLRDHCRCSQCYNHQTYQSKIDLAKIPFDIRPKSCEEVGEKLKITWPDDHQTEFNLNFLQNIIGVRKKPQKQIVLWNAEKIPSLEDTTITCKEYFENSDGKKRLLSSILKHGFAFVTQVEPTLEATENVVRHTTLVKKTHFGEMWKVTNDQEVEDTAYTSIALDAHNDNTYFSEATGLMVFHKVERQGKGGRTLLVDGFNAATNLKDEDPQAFDILTRFPIESEFVGVKKHYTSVEPVIKLHPVTGELMQIRYNHYDRAFLNSLPFEDIMDFYMAYIKFGKEIKKSSNQWWLQLEPGTVLFFDNWRLLHGREEFTGKRKLTGCYVSRRDWTSEAKVHGLSFY